MITPYGWVDMATLAAHAEKWHENANSFYTGTRHAAQKWTLLTVLFCKRQFRVK